MGGRGRGRGRGKPKGNEAAPTALPPLSSSQSATVCAAPAAVGAAPAAVGAAPAAAGRSRGRGRRGVAQNPDPVVAAAANCAPSGEVAGCISLPISLPIALHNPLPISRPRGGGHGDAAANGHAAAGIQRTHTRGSSEFLADWREIFKLP